MMARYWIYRTSGDDMSKPVKKVGKAIRKAGEKFDRTIGLKAQKDILQREGSNLMKTLTGTPKIVQEEATQPAGAVDRQAIRPLAALSGATENQEEATRELYRRRRARGVATSPMGLTGQANVQRKTLLGS